MGIVEIDITLYPDLSAFAVVFPHGDYTYTLATANGVDWYTDDMKDARQLHFIDQLRVRYLAEVAWETVRQQQDKS